MPEGIKVVGLGGSVKPSSTSRAALTIALEGAAQSGAETRLLDIRELNLPLYDPGATVAPESARRMCEEIYEAHGLIWSSPMYHGTISGAFKNALDWLQLLSDRNPPFLTDKVVGLISTAGGVQGLQAVNTMEFVVRALRGWAVPLVLPIPHAWEVFNEEGRADALCESQLHRLGQEVARASRQLAGRAIAVAEVE